MKPAPFACRPELSLGRAAGEPASDLRSVYQRDRDRIVHCTAFRRLEYKTQVFVNFEGDHYRTRLTHSLEVAQIARTLARVLGVDEDLAEAVALAHDLGHSPFGHAGEAALQDELAPFGGFDHNLQTFRILTRLERRYADFDGLNLTFETLEGVVKHNGPVGAPHRLVAEHAIAGAVALDAQAPVEAQIAAIADDVAYCNHDLDDGLRAGFLELGELADLPLTGPSLREVDHAHPALDPARRTAELIRRLIDRMVRDLLTEANLRLDRLAPTSPDDVRRAREPVVAFSRQVGEDLANLREFLRLRVYRHYKVARMTLKAQRVVRELLGAFLTAPECLPDGWRDRAGPPQSQQTAEAVRDYVAGMTDRYALDEHDRLFRLSRKSL